MQMRMLLQRTWWVLQRTWWVLQRTWLLTNASSQLRSPSPTRAAATSCVVHNTRGCGCAATDIRCRGTTQQRLTQARMGKSIRAHLVMEYPHIHFQVLRFFGSPLVPSLHPSEPSSPPIMFSQLLHAPSAMDASAYATAQPAKDFSAAFVMLQSTRCTNGGFQPPIHAYSDKATKEDYSEFGASLPPSYESCISTGKEKSGSKFAKSISRGSLFNSDGVRVSLIVFCSFHEEQEVRYTSYFTPNKWPTFAQYSDYS